MLSRAGCVFVVFAAACGGETDAVERCFPAGDGVTVLDGLEEIESARDLKSVDGDLIVCNFSGAASLPNLQVVSGSLRFLTTSPATVSLPSLVRTGGELQTSVDMVVPQLKECAGLSSSGFVTGRLSLPALTRVGELYREGAVDAPELLAADKIRAGPLLAPKLRRFNHALLAPFGDSQLPLLDNFISADLDLADVRGTVSLPAVREVEEIRFLTNTEPNVTERIRMPALQTAGHLAFVSQAGLASVDFPSLTSLKTMDVIKIPESAYCQLKALAEETGATLNSVGNDDAEPCN